MWSHEETSSALAVMLSGRKLLKWGLVLLLAPVFGYIGLRLTFTRPMTEVEVIVPVSSTATNACLMHALDTTFGSDLVRRGQNFAMVNHRSCLVSGRGNAVLYYEITARKGQQYLSISDSWRSIDRVTSDCARATGAEIRRAIEAFVTECDPGLVGQWNSRCNLSGAHASENFCPDPKANDGPVGPR
jgi:hypothetical protein